MESVNVGSILTLLIKSLSEEIKQYLNDILKENNNWQKISNIVKAICLDEKLKKCQKCGKQLKYSQHNFCCKKCAQNSQLVRQKFKNTNKEKFGVQFPIQSKEIKEKRNNNNLEKYRCKKSYLVSRNSK